MAEMGTEPDPEPDSDSKIWKLTGTGARFGVLTFRAGSVFRVNFLTPPISAARVLANESANSFSWQSILNDQGRIRSLEQRECVGT